MRTLVEHMKKKDHWECLEDLTQELGRAARTIAVISQGMDESIIDARQELPEQLAKAFILIEVSRVKLAVLADEWNKTMGKTIDEMSKTEVNFDSHEF